MSDGKLIERDRTDYNLAFILSVAMSVALFLISNSLLLNNPSMSSYSLQNKVGFFKPSYAKVFMTRPLSLQRIWSRLLNEHTLSCHGPLHLPFFFLSDHSTSQSKYPLLILLQRIPSSPVCSTSYMLYIVAYLVQYLQLYVGLDIFSIRLGAFWGQELHCTYVCIYPQPLIQRLGHDRHSGNSCWRSKSIGLYVSQPGSWSFSSLTF